MHIKYVLFYLFIIAKQNFQTQYLERNKQLWTTNIQDY